MELDKNLFSGRTTKHSYHSLPGNGKSTLQTMNDMLHYLIESRRYFFIVSLYYANNSIFIRKEK